LKAGLLKVYNTLRAIHNLLKPGEEIVDDESEGASLARRRRRRRRLTFWNIWLAWIAANAIAWTVGFGLAQIYSRALYANDSYIQRVLEGADYIWTRPLDSPVATANYGLMLGAAIGLGQWLVLRRRFDIKWQWWLAATALGFTLHGLLLGLSVGQTASGEVNDTALGLLCASVALLGVPQWLVLRLHLKRAGWWLLGSFVGLVLAGPDRAGGTSSLLGWIAVSLGAGATFGIVTAFFLYFMMPVEPLVATTAEEE
jgi:hypothetical protein